MLRGDSPKWHVVVHMPPATVWEAELVVRRSWVEGVSFGMLVVSDGQESAFRLVR